MSKTGHTPPDHDTKLPRPLVARVEQWQRSGHYWRSGWHSHPWGQWSYATQGTLLVKTPDSCYFAFPKLAIWIPPHVKHLLQSTSPKGTIKSLYVANERLPEPAGNRFM
ncbi:AraC family ligand binding domain-containing protein [Dongshaea marina]|uniref:AraC family ligand binding domain-containing protein n=1 Tax=Dongshaea marina TaxID=2047966 RepID=UPI000D3E1A08|nr:AraC family ligand binding domain-containing protein [Dongshaea marina]